MRIRIGQRELRNDSGEIMRRVAAGEAFVVTRNGTPIADLTPHDPDAFARPDRYVAVQAVAGAMAGLPDWGAAAFRRDLTELDGAFDDSERDPWTAA